MTVREEAVVADANECAGKNVEEVSADEFGCWDGHRLGATAILVVLVDERDVAILDRDDALVADGDSMGVARQVFDSVQRAPARRFDVNDPVFVVQGVEEGLERCWV